MKKRAFVLIEFLAAVFLATIILMASLTLLRILLRGSREALVGNGATLSVVDEVSRVVERDLIHANRLEALRNTLVITSSLVNDDPRPLLVRIRYTLEEIRGVPCLFREADNEPARRALVCTHLTKWHLATSESGHWSTPIVLVDREVPKAIARSVFSHRMTDQPLQLSFQIDGRSLVRTVYPRGLP